jgi:hypothetical protein
VRFQRPEIPREIVRALRRVRVTWCVMLASMLAFFALPWLVDELHQSLTDDPRRPSYFEVTEVPPGEFPMTSRSYLMWMVFALCLVLAAVVPRRLHAQATRRMPLLGAERVVTRGTYRTLPTRCFVVTTSFLDRLQGAYCARLGLTLLLLWPGLVIAGYHAAWPSRWYSAVMGCGVCFAGVQEYLPMIVAATLLLVANAPTPRRVLGPFAPGFESRALLVQVDGEA